MKPPLPTTTSTDKLDIPKLGFLDAVETDGIAIRDVDYLKSRFVDDEGNTLQWKEINNSKGKAKKWKLRYRHINFYLYEAKGSVRYSHWLKWGGSIGKYLNGHNVAYISSDEAATALQEIAKLIDEPATQIPVVNLEFCRFLDVPRAPAVYVDNAYRFNNREFNVWNTDDALKGATATQVAKRKNKNKVKDDDPDFIFEIMSSIKVYCPEHALIDACLKFERRWRSSNMPASLKRILPANLKSKKKQTKKKKDSHVSLATLIDALQMPDKKLYSAAHESLIDTARRVSFKGDDADALQAEFMAEMKRHHYSHSAGIDYSHSVEGGHSESDYSHSVDSDYSHSVEGSHSALDYSHSVGSHSESNELEALEALTRVAVDSEAVQDEATESELAHKGHTNPLTPLNSLNSINNVNSEKSELGANLGDQPVGAKDDESTKEAPKSDDDSLRGFGVEEGEEGKEVEVEEEEVLEKEVEEVQKAKMARGAEQASTDLEGEGDNIEAHQKEIESEMERLANDIEAKRKRFFELDDERAELTNFDDDGVLFDDEQEEPEPDDSDGFEVVEFVDRAKVLSKIKPTSPHWSVPSQEDQGEPEKENEDSSTPETTSDSSASSDEYPVDDEPTSSDGEGDAFFESMIDNPTLPSPDEIKSVMRDLSKSEVIDITQRTLELSPIWTSEKSLASNIKRMRSKKSQGDVIDYALDLLKVSKSGGIFMEIASHNLQPLTI